MTTLHQQNDSFSRKEQSIPPSIGPRTSLCPDSLDPTVLSSHASGNPGSHNSQIHNTLQSERPAPRPSIDIATRITLSILALVHESHRKVDDSLSIVELRKSWKSMSSEERLEGMSSLIKSLQGSNPSISLAASVHSVLKDIAEELDDGAQRRVERLFYWGLVNDRVSELYEQLVEKLSRQCMTLEDAEEMAGLWIRLDGLGTVDFEAEGTKMRKLKRDVIRIVGMLCANDESKGETELKAALKRANLFIHQTLQVHERLKAEQVEKPQKDKDMVAGEKRQRDDEYDDSGVEHTLLEEMDYNIYEPPWASRVRFDGKKGRPRVRRRRSCLSRCFSNGFQR